MKVLNVFLSAILATEGVVATGGLNGLPYLNGPIPVVDKRQPGMKQRLGDMIHPGLWHTHDDLERMRNGVLHHKEPWSTAYKAFSNDSYSQADYVMQGPHAVISRGGPAVNQSSFTSDVRAAYQNAVMWYITKDQGHWYRSTTILDSWGTNLTDIIGTDASLLVGLEGTMFANAAEIMRWEGNWTEVGAKAIGSSGFSNQLYWLFARQSIIIGQANYGMASIKALLDFGVYLDDISMYNYGLNAYFNDPCAGIYGNLHAETGQSAEAGRDQGHTQGGLGWMSEAARTVQSQGFDLYGYADNLLLKGAEYAARYNLGDDSVPYDRKYYRCEGVLVNAPWAGPSEISRGIVGGKTSQIWNMIYYQYVVKRGLHAPWTTKAKKQFDAGGGERHQDIDDHPGWGDLLFAYDGPGKYNNDNDRTIWGGGKIGPDGVGNINAQ